MKILLMIAILSGWSATPQAQSLDALVDQVVVAYGGQEALGMLSSYRIEGQVAAHRRGVSGTTVRRFEAPGRFRVDLDYGTFSELRILDGDAGWRGARDGVVPAQGPLLDSMRSQMLRSDIPGALARHRSKLVDRGASAVDGREHRLLELAFSAELTVLYWVDPETHRIRQAEGRLQGGGMNMSFVTRYADYRWVDGVLLAHLEENWAGGTHVATTRIETLVFENHAATTFQPPVGGRREAANAADGRGRGSRSD